MPMLRPAVRPAVCLLGILSLVLTYGCNSPTKDDPAPSPSEPSAKPAASAAATPAAAKPKPAKKPLGAAPEVGTERTVEKSTTTKVRTLYQGRDVVIGNETSETTSEKVLAVEEGAIHKLRVTYDSASRVRTMGGSDQKAPSVIAGKTYIVERDGSKVIVTDKDGKPVSDDESKEVAKDYSGIGKADPLLGAVPKRKLTEGEPVAEVEEALKRFFIDLGDDKNEVTVKKVTAKLTGTTESDHIFAVTVSMQMKSPRQAFIAELKGEFHSRKADNWPSNVEVEGPVDVKIAGNAGVSQGSMKIRLAIRY